MNLKRFIINNKKILSVFFTIVFSVFVVAALVYGATTIGNNITTGGNVFATGTIQADGLLTLYGNADIGDAYTDTLTILSVIDGALWASSTLQVTDASTFYATTTWSGVGSDLVIEGLSTSTMAGNLDIAGDFAANRVVEPLLASSTLVVDGLLTLYGNADIGDAYTDTLTILSVIDGALWASSTLQVDGLVTLYGSALLGDGANDYFSASGTTMLSEAATTSHIYPWSANTYDLGTADTAWRSLYASGTSYLDSVLFSNSATTSHLYPLASNTYDLGGSDYEWRNIYSSGTAFLSIINILNASGTTMLSEAATTSHIYPWANNTYDLGTADTAWGSVYSSGTLFSNSATFFTTTTFSGLGSDLVVEGAGTSTFAGDVLIGQASASGATTTLHIGTDENLAPGQGGCIALRSTATSTDTQSVSSTLYLLVIPNGDGRDLEFTTSTNPADCY